MTGINPKNIIVKESITQALLILMENKDFEKITITDIVNKAGVVRMSFYRNYTSKEDVILKHLYEIYEKWGKNINNDDPSKFISNTYKKSYFMYGNLYGANG